MKPDVKKIIADIKATKGNRKFCNGLAGTLQDDNYASSICKYVKTVTPERIDLLIEYAEKLEAEVTDMAVQLANAESKCRELAAENVGQKSGVTYFAFAPEYGFDYFTNMQDAIDTAQAEIDAYRDDAFDGWDEDVRRVSWGIVIQQADGFDADGVHISDRRHTYQTCDYQLVDTVKTPVADAFLAEVLAQAHKEGADFVANRMLAAWEAGFIEDTAKNAADIARMILTSTEFMPNAPQGDFDRSFADGVLEDIAAQLRKGVQS